MAYLVGHSSRCINVTGATPVPERLGDVRPLARPEWIAEWHELEIVGPTSEGSNVVVAKEKIWWHEGDKATKAKFWGY